MKKLPTRAARAALLSTAAVSALGATAGGLLAAAVVVGFTEILKGLLALVSRQQTWVLIAAPVAGLALSVLVLYGFGVSSEAGDSARRWASAWRTFPPRVSRPDLTGDTVGYAGEEERVPWRLAPIRLLAMIATVGCGSAMGTEAPAAYLGVAAGAALGDRWWRRFARPAAVGGGAAGVAALIGIPLLGAAYILELGRRHHAPLNAERVTAALVGGYVGWMLNLALGVKLFTLVIPREPPDGLYQAIVTALLIGALSGAITALSGAAIYRAKTYTVHPILRLALGGLALGLAATMLAAIAAPSAAIGPGSGAIDWAQSTSAGAVTIRLSIFSALWPLRPRLQRAAAAAFSYRFLPSEISPGASFRPCCECRAILPAQPAPQAASAAATICLLRQLRWFSSRAALRSPE